MRTQICTTRKTWNRLTELLGEAFGPGDFTAAQIEEILAESEGRTVTISFQMPEKVVAIAQAASLASRLRIAAVN